jgi:hypothetical protein
MVIYRLIVGAGLAFIVARLFHRQFGRRGHLLLVLIVRLIVVLDISHIVAKIVRMMYTFRIVCVVADMMDAFQPRVGRVADMAELMAALRAYVYVSNVFLFPHSDVLTRHVVAATTLLVSSSAFFIRAFLRFVLYLLTAQLFLLYLRKLERSHALVVGLVSLIVVKRDVVSRAVTMAALTIDEDISIGCVVKLAVSAFWCNAVAEVWFVAEELLDFETVVSSEHIRVGVYPHHLVVECSLAYLGSVWALDVVQIYGSADPAVKPLHNAVATHRGYVGQSSKRGKSLIKVSSPQALQSR